jgi:hypothetical protein
MTFFNDQQTNLSRRSLLKGLGACAALPLLGTGKIDYVTLKQMAEKA